MTTTELQPASVAAPRPELDWERDGNGRPRILPDPTWDDATRQKWQAGRAWDDGTVGYTRVTTFAEALQDSSALTRWKMRREALGFGRRPDYVTAAAALSLRDEDRDALDDLAEKALEAAGPNAADVGTALHAFTERMDRGEELGVVPEQYVATLEEYRRVSSHLRFVEFECRTVCDELETAGTPDRMGFCDVPDPDGVVDELRVIDTKTGRVDYSAGKFSTQLAIYRRSRKYHPGTGARTSWEELHGAPVSRWGIVVHVPAGAGTAELLWLDLDHGWTGAELAGKVRAWRTGASGGQLLRPVFARPPRPATADGSCRGRKQDGRPCGYRAKAAGRGLDELQRQFCGRHQEQARDLERWLAENPDVDPADGVEQLPGRDPVQPSFPPVQLEGTADVVQHPSGHVEVVGPVVPLRDTGVLSFAGKFPNGVLTAGVGARAVSAEDGRTWVKVRDVESLPSHGWELAPEDRDAAATRAVQEQLQRAEQLAAARLEDEAAPDDAGPDQGEAADVAAASGEYACPWCSDTGCSVCQPEGDQLTASSTDVAARAFAGAQAASAVAAEAQRPARELAGYPPADMPQRPFPAPVGTYAIDPEQEQNGNRRPVSGLQTPDDAEWAAAQARRGVLRQLQVAQTEAELVQVYQQAAAAGLWTQDATAMADERQQELRRRQQFERPEAALLAALEHAPDTDTLTRLWSQYPQQLWTPEAHVLARTRWEQLTGH